MLTQGKQVHMTITTSHTILDLVYCFLIYVPVIYTVHNAVTDPLTHFYFCRVPHTCYLLLHDGVLSRLIYFLTEEILRNF